MSNAANAAKNFDILAINLSVLRNYFGGLRKLFSDLYRAKILDLSAKLFFPCSKSKITLHSSFIIFTFATSR